MDNQNEIGARSQHRKKTVETGLQQQAASNARRLGWKSGAVPDDEPDTSHYYVGLKQTTAGWRECARLHTEWQTVTGGHIVHLRNRIRSGKHIGPVKPKPDDKTQLLVLKGHPAQERTQGKPRLSPPRNTRPILWEDLNYQV